MVKTKKKIIDFQYKGYGLHLKVTEKHSLRDLRRLIGKKITSFMKPSGDDWTFSVNDIQVGAKQQENEMLLWRDIIREDGKYKVELIEKKIPASSLKRKSREKEKDEDPDFIIPEEVKEEPEDPGQDTTKRRIRKKIDPATVTPERVSSNDRSVTPENTNSGGLEDAVEDPIPDPAPSSHRTRDEVRRDVFRTTGTDARIKEEGCASSLSEEEREKRKKCLDQWIRANTDPRTGRGRYVFRRGCHKQCITTVLAGTGTHPWPKVKNPPLVNGEPNPFVVKGEFYVAGVEGWNPFGPRFPGDTGLVNLAAFKQNPQSKQEEFHLFVECSKYLHKRHWHGKDAREGYMYVGVYRKVKDEDGDDEIVTPVSMNDPDLDMDCRVAISEHHLKWNVQGNPNFMTSELFLQFKEKAQKEAQEAGEEWNNYSDRKQNSLAMYWILLEVENFTQEFVPVEFVRYDEDLYQALVDVGAVCNRGNMLRRVDLTAEALHQWY